MLLALCLKSNHEAQDYLGLRCFVFRSVIHFELIMKGVTPVFFKVDINLFQHYHLLKRIFLL